MKLRLVLGNCKSPLPQNQLEFFFSGVLTPKYCCRIINKPITLILHCGWERIYFWFLHFFIYSFIFATFLISPPPFAFLLSPFPLLNNKKQKKSKMLTINMTDHQNKMPYWPLPKTCLPLPPESISSCKRGGDPASSSVLWHHGFTARWTELEVFPICQSVGQ